MNKILKFEILGMVFISILGSLLHFTFEFFNRAWPVGLFSAVNESTWEHLKLAVMPTIFWAILESRFFKLKLNNFIFAKAFAIWLMPVLIIVFFYSYVALLGYNFLAADISVFVLSVIIGQLVSYKIMMVPKFSQKYNAISFWLMIILLLAFFVFTFYPPHFFLFHDPVSEGYGIII